ncbi:hypothetical protein [Neorhodopirellula pilleata]|uniref:Uncharacterized protein n=1 Tax=Neorhodopirellula pilleata TaxID=2714738 RepID=A0A5C5ZQN9_9BACT|nr:hypothetical protein [Neorhodopirellula pilleata]TWT89580.1 hypothetical protein Pla100_55090 [Neorhodopirellula pilleata]
MKFELPGQLRGPECRRVISLAIALRRRLEPWSASIIHSDIDTLSIVLRIDGSLGTFGPPGVEGVAVNSGVLACDLVIEDFGWDGVSDDRIDSILAERVVDAIAECFRHVGLPAPSADLLEVADGG